MTQVENENDDRTFVPKVVVKVLRYQQQGGNNSPTEFSLFATLEDSCEDLDLVQGTIVEIRMDEFPLSHNCLLPDLMNGYERDDIPACGENSLIKFMGCKAMPGENVIQAAAYEVIEARIPKVEHASEQSMSERVGAAVVGPAHRLWPSERLGAAVGGPAHRLWP